MAGPPSKRLTVMISSTARDLPEHRKQLIEACLRQALFPQMMEFLAAEDVGEVEIDPPDKFSARSADDHP